METLTCRLLPYAVADGPHNMAADEALLHSALAGAASLRFYGWSAATVSLGYFQPARVRLGDPLLAALPFVRRPSGGDTLIHHHELTYALALPHGPPWQARGMSWLVRMHAIIAAALKQFGVAACLYESHGGQRFVGPLCFQHFTVGDLMLGDAKIAGSAQRKHRGALLQHGAILLARSEHAPSLPGIRDVAGRAIAIAELADAISHEFARETKWILQAVDWSEAESGRQAELVNHKYATAAWNDKR